MLWVFVLLSGFGARHLTLEVTLDGTLPGEEHIDREALVSICWRLIPYWLSAWEQAWGAECSSMLFELPHFAVELLIVLPLVQVCAPYREVQPVRFNPGSATCEVQPARCST